MEDKIITQCPHCKSKFKLGTEKVGKKIRCPKCSGVFEVQAFEATPAPSVSRPEPKAAPVAAKPEPKAAPVAAKPEPPAAPAPAAQEVVPLDQRPRPLKPKDFFETQFMRFIPEKAAGVEAQIWYELTGEDGGSWTVSIHDGAASVKEGPDQSAKTHVIMADKTYMKIATNKLDSRVAFMLGKIKIKGDKQSVASVRECFNPANVEA